MEAPRRTGRKGEGVFHRNQEGASALEFALVLPILVVLIFGAFTVGVSYDRKLSVAHAARDGARYGATLEQSLEDSDNDGTPDSPPVVEDEWFENIRDRAVAASTGHLLAFGEDATSICVAYVEGSLGATIALTATSKAITYTGDGSSWTASEESGPNGYCWLDGLGDDPADPDPDLEPRIQVVTSRPVNFNAVLIPARVITLTSQSLARYER